MFSVCTSVFSEKSNVESKMPNSLIEVRHTCFLSQRGLNSQQDVGMFSLLKEEQKSNHKLFYDLIH